IVPGWYGMASAKWVTRVRIEAEPSDNHFMVRGYRYVAPGGDPLTSPPVEEMRVKSVITRPLDGSRVSLPLAKPPKRLQVRGAASGARATPSVPAKIAYSSALPDSAGRAIVERWCTLCHSAMLITQQAKDSTAWEKTLGQMEKWGATPTPEERDTLRAYLVQCFGPRVAPVPKAPAPAPAQPR